MKHCPTCLKPIETVLDFPLVQVVSVETFDLPKRAYTSRAINGPAEMETQRAAGLWLNRVEVMETDPGAAKNGNPTASRRIYLLDRYTGVAGAGAAFKRFMTSGGIRMEFEDLLFEKQFDSLHGADVFTVRRDVLPQFRKTIGTRWLPAYVEDSKRAVGRVVPTRSLAPRCAPRGRTRSGQSLFANGGIGVALWPEERAGRNGLHTVKLAATFSDGGSISVIEPLFFLASLSMKGILVAKAGRKPDHINGRANSHARPQSHVFQK